MPQLALKPTHKVVQTYYDSLAKFAELGINHESAVRSAFQELLELCARQLDLKLVPEYALKRKAGRPLKADGAFLDHYGLRHGVWEAKDTADDLEKDIKAKFAAGYPKENILFQEPRRAVLFQDSQRVYEADLTQPDQLVYIVKLFFEFVLPVIAEWEEAVERFKEKVPELGANLQRIIHNERETSPKFRAAFDDFYRLGCASLNPNLAESAVELVRRVRHHFVVEFGREGVSRHADHKVMCEVALSAVDRSGDPTWDPREGAPAWASFKLYQFEIAQEIFAGWDAPLSGVPRARLTAFIDTSEQVETKIRAFHCHKTQAKDTRRLIERPGYREFARQETYVLARTRLPGLPLPEDDLLAGIPDE